MGILIALTTMSCLALVLVWLSVHQRTGAVTSSIARTAAASMAMLHETLQSHDSSILSNTAMGDDMSTMAMEPEDHLHLPELTEALADLRFETEGLVRLFEQDTALRSSQNIIPEFLQIRRMPDSVRAIWDRDETGKSISELLAIQIETCLEICEEPRVTPEQQHQALLRLRDLAVWQLLPRLRDLETAAMQWQESAFLSSRYVISFAFVAIAIAALLIWRLVISPLIRHAEASASALAVSNSQLEQKVRDRTAELSLALEDAQASIDAKTAFLANMSHEIRTPLNGVLGIATVMEATGLTKEQSQYIKIILQSGNLLKRIVDDVLDTAQLSGKRMSISPRPIDVSDVISDVIALLQPVAASNDQTIRLRCGNPNGALVLADPERLQQIVNNLVGNSIKFSGPGEITVFTNSTLKSDNHMSFELTVSDNGPGIDQELQARLFEPFERGTAADHVEGAGLGLALVRTIVREMGGVISLQSAPGAGVRFQVTLPLRSASKVIEPEEDVAFRRAIAS